MTDISAVYENTIAGHVDTANAVAFGYARHAIVAALTAAGLKPDDEVILSPLTCKVVPLALLSMGLKPVYADISPDTLNINHAEVQEKITTATRAILFQHTYGHPGGVEDIASLARQMNIFMIEDCAQCMPLRIDNYHPGQHGNVAIFSNNAGKPLSAGSGGIAVTNDVMLTEEMRKLRDTMSHRKLADDLLISMETWLHHHLLRPSLYWLLFTLRRRIDSNYSQHSLDAEIANEITKTAMQPSSRQLRRGLHAMRHITSVAHHRITCCKDFHASLGPANRPGTLFESGKAPLYYYPVLTDHKPELLQLARQSRVEIIPWPISTPIYPVEDIAALGVYGYRAGDCPEAESVAARLVGLPTHIKITPEVRKQIISLVQTQVR